LNEGEFVTIDVSDAQIDEPKPENEWTEGAKAQRRAAGAWQQAPGATDSEDSRQALREQISGTVRLPALTGKDLEALLELGA
jgi:hypothetical protein